MEAQIQKNAKHEQPAVVKAQDGRTPAEGKNIGTKELDAGGVYLTMAVPHANSEGA